MTYQHLSQEERYQIQASIQSGFSNVEIARQLQRSPSTILRERTRARAENPRRYVARKAQARAEAVWSAASSRPRISPETWRIVEREIRQRKSPEQIRGSGKAQVSIERIYQYIAEDKHGGGDLWTYRRRRHRRRRIGSPKSRQRFGGKRIAQRNPRVDLRKTTGHWEADSVLGKGPKRLITLVERKTGYLKMALVANGSAAAAHAAILEKLHPLRSRVKTITYDNGSEFALHDFINQTLGSESFFADPHAPWQRGTNENTNGLIRQYLPKGHSMNDQTPEDIQTIEDALNSRPRKRLQFKTPRAMFFASLKIALRN